MRSAAGKMVRIDQDQTPVAAKALVGNKGVSNRTCLLLVLLASETWRNHTVVAVPLNGGDQAARAGSLKVAAGDGCMRRSDGCVQKPSRKHDDAGTADSHGQPACANDVQDAPRIG